MAWRGGVCDTWPHAWQGSVRSCGPSRGVRIPAPHTGTFAPDFLVKEVSSSYSTTPRSLSIYFGGERSLYEGEERGRSLKSGVILKTG